jgi:hypothetical protein
MYGFGCGSAAQDIPWADCIRVLGSEFWVLGCGTIVPKPFSADFADGRGSDHIQSAFIRVISGKNNPWFPWASPFASIRAMADVASLGTRLISPS